MSNAYISAALRREVTERFHGRCAYCQTPEYIAGMQFTIDHIVPESLGGTTTTANLCLACWDCNMIKQNRIVGLDPETDETVPLFHPIQQQWDEHFSWQAKGLYIDGQTATGRATVATLRLNRPILLPARERWIKAGWHPPSDT